MPHLPVCRKLYPRRFVNKPQTEEGDLLSLGGGDFSSDQRGAVTVGSCWIVPYCPRLSKIFNSVINIELFNSVKRVKYICKHVSKGSDQTAFVVASENNDQIQRYQIHRYITTPALPAHDRNPAVVQRDVRLELGQRGYFTVDISEKIKYDESQYVLRHSWS